MLCHYLKGKNVLKLKTFSRRKWSTWRSVPIGTSLSHMADTREGVPALCLPVSSRSFCEHHFPWPEWVCCCCCCSVWNQHMTSSFDAAGETAVGVGLKVPKLFIKKTTVVIGKSQAMVGWEQTPGPRRPAWWRQPGRRAAPRLHTQGHGQSPSHWYWRCRFTSWWDLYCSAR